jgi:phage terminase large subunit
MPLWSALEGGKKRAIEIAHRRWGKDDVALHWAAVAAHTRVAGYWHMLPEYAQARKAIWNAVNPHTGRRRIDEAFPLELREATNEQEMFIRFKTGSTWQVVGSDSYDRLVGASVAGVTFSEWALANPSAWGYIQPILAENNGWAMFITTPRGDNHAKAMLDMARDDPKNWYAEVSSVQKTGAMTNEALENARRELIALYGDDVGPAQFEQEYLCSFNAAILGAFYGKEMADADRDGRIAAVPLDPALPVHRAWDLGIRDSTAIWFFQIAGREIRLVDYYEAHGQSIEHYADVIDARGYGEGKDYVPHDAKVRELGTGRTRIETMASHGLKPVLVPAHKILDGVQATRQSLPYCYFDAVKCKQGIAALKQYRREWDDERKTFKPSALHDWSSHGADAFRYMAVAWRDVVKPAEITPKPVDELFKPPTLGELTRMHDRASASEERI